jgi:SNF family Na+-dependent transporter
MNGIKVSLDKLKKEFLFKFYYIKVSGKLVYFTSIFPYVILLILGIRGWMLEGAEEGIKFFIYPDFNRLKDFNVWMDAAVQILFT